ncbi:hypothetical protein ALC56_00703 [Trachymyrmex septentrionalis]|uniref:Uncharacterized protein n=1 Tax=Trachymyrmex septentrionalis TaxID=34720 RepID=A0A195FW88_9HYME|nr:hypothetical protein ALC56_00703 [Trachymyrmex septentrionalis]
MQKLIDLCVPITAESTFPDRFRGELYLSIPAMEIKNLIVPRMKMDTLIKSNEFCNATPFMNRPIEVEDQRSCSQPRKTEGLESLDLEDGPRQAEREASRSSLNFPTRSQIPHFRGKRSTDDILIYTFIFGNRFGISKPCRYENCKDKLNIFHYKVAQVLDKWKEVGLIGRHYFFMAQLVLISEIQQFSCTCIKILDQQPTTTKAKLCRQASTSFTEQRFNDVPYLICFVIVFVLLEDQSLDDTDTRFGIWHFRLINSMISFISNV